MSRRPVVISPITPLFRRDGVDVALVSVELWRTQTIIRLAALVDDPLGAETAFGDALDAWAEGGRRPPAPDAPGDRFYQDVAISLADDVGTDYAWQSSAVGGTGRLFCGDWHFPVGVPEKATRLIVKAAGGDGEGGSIELPLS